MFSNNGETGSARATRPSSVRVGTAMNPRHQSQMPTPVIFSQNRSFRSLPIEQEVTEIGEWNFSCAISPVGKLR